MKKNPNNRKLLDLKKIDIAFLKDSEKSRIYGGNQTYAEVKHACAAIRTSDCPTKACRL